jgi:hypothetical protein
MTNFEIIQTIANVATACTFGAAAWQLWESNKQTRKSAIQKRSEYVIDLYNTFTNDKDMVKIYYKLEYSEFRYDDNFHGSQTEKQLDKLLGHFSNIGRLFNLGILTREDLKFLEYEFLVIYQNENIQEYLKFLDGWFKLRQINDKKFEYFRLTGQALEKDNNIQLKKN